MRGFPSSGRHFVVCPSVQFVSFCSARQCAVCCQDEERRAVLAAQQRADDAELQLQMMSQQSESRAVGLESRLTELSETLGNVERLRQQDQQVIQKLRERLVQVRLTVVVFNSRCRCH